MKLRILSDLHLEFGMLEVTSLPDDKDTVLVLAGDIFTGMRANDFVIEMCQRFKDVIYIMGNHEFYGHDITTIVENWRFIGQHIENLHVLEKDYAVFEDVMFIGATMWTDFNNNDWHARWTAQRGMNDFRTIAHFNAHDWMAYHAEFKEFLGSNLRWNVMQDNYKVVLITHHLPIMDCVDTRFKNTGVLNYAYACTDMEDFVVDHNIALWIYGHTHEAADFVKHDTRFVCNPRGYHGYEINAKNYNTEKIVEI